MVIPPPVHVVRNINTTVQKGELEPFPDQAFEKENAIISITEEDELEHAINENAPDLKPAPACGDTPIEDLTLDSPGAKEVFKFKRKMYIPNTNKILVGNFIDAIDLKPSIINYEYFKSLLFLGHPEDLKS